MPPFYRRTLNKTIVLFVIICTCRVFVSKSLGQNPWATQVISSQFGTNQTLGQSPDYFPANVLGAVSPDVSATTPSATPETVVSLGRDGWLVLGFENPIVDGVGADFTVFENAFEIMGGQGVFDEWIQVSVSPDGVNWIEFPADTLTGVGMAGRTPTEGGTNLNYQDPSQSGGDSFDLATVGLSQIKFIKLKDATRYQSPDRLSAEVDAVIGIHFLTTPIAEAQTSPLFISRIEDHHLFATALLGGRIVLSDIRGNILAESILDITEKKIPLPPLSNGMYILQFISIQGKSDVRKFFLIEN